MGGLTTSSSSYFRATSSAVLERRVAAAVPGIWLWLASLAGCAMLSRTELSSQVSGIGGRWADDPAIGMVSRMGCVFGLAGEAPGELTA